MGRRSRVAGVGLFAAVLLAPSTPAFGGAEVRLDRDFLATVVEKIPPAPFKKDGQYRGTVRAFRLAGIEAKGRRLLVACEVAGEFRPPVAAAIKNAASGGNPGNPGGWKAFTFDVKVGVRVEPGFDGAPKFAVDVEEVRRRELEGVAGLLAKVLGRLFDDMVTQAAAGKAALLSAKVNAEVVKRVGAFRQYGVLREIDYTTDELVLKFDVTRLKSEGVVGHVFPAPAPGTVPLYRWVHARRGLHYYTTSPETLNLPWLGFVYEGPACYVPAGPGPGVTAWHRWRGAREWFYTTDPGGEGLAGHGYRPEGFACFLFAADAPPPGSVPFYRFVDPKTGVHFFTVHPHAEFAK